MSANKHLSHESVRPPWSSSISFPPALPITARTREIANAIQDHQVIIVAGETGSGKTTQIPKICLSLGYGERGQIAHTQPRRIAARTVADRIAQELQTPLGQGVGYQVRFVDKSCDETRIKLMTDGVLLAEFQNDPLLRKYDVIIIDEAHERSLNIDFLLGLLKTIVEKRQELRVIITSATIDLEKFAHHFRIEQRPAPIIEVSGRTYPVELIYQEPKEPINLADQIFSSISEIIQNEAKGNSQAGGDILVFCVGEREIRDLAAALRRTNLPIAIVPLYSRLSVTEQNRAFQKAQQRKVILATNVAETSITVPGISYVIDPGLARISRYSFRSKVQRLPIEPISKASANQRMGRSGRMANGVCIRLYSQQDFEQRANFTPAEILRSNLASVVLKMLRLGIKDINKFPFIDRPDKRLLNDGFKLLQNFGALTQQNKLNKVGYQLSNLSVDPKYGRILIEANRIGCLRDALILVSGLSVQDPREYPSDNKQAATQAHQRLNHSKSDFFSYLHLWQAITDAKQQLSNSKFRAYCLENYWSIARIFEWRELFGQLQRQCRRTGWKLEPWGLIQLPVQRDAKTESGFSKRYENLHRALLAGTFDNVATKELDEQYLATRNRRVHIFPTSGQAKRKPKWLVAGDYIETSRLYALSVGEVQPSWIINATRALCSYQYSEPNYEKRTGRVKVNRKTVYSGLVLQNREQVDFAPINATEAREVFIQHALVAGAYEPRGKIASNAAAFVEHNRRLITKVENLETKTRRRNLLANDQSIYDFYAAHLPNEIVSRSALEKWLTQGNKHRLKFDENQFLPPSAGVQTGAQFPDQVDVLGKRIQLIYTFDPGNQSDGVTMVIPIGLLEPFPTDLGSWLVPGLLKEKCVALIKTLPKPIRKHFAPATNTVEQIFSRLKTNTGLLQAQLADTLYRTHGVKVSANDFDFEKLDAFYQMNYRVIDVDKSLVQESRNLHKLKTSYANAVQQSVHSSQAAERLALERDNLNCWNFGALTEAVDYQHQGMTVRAYPMLIESSDNTIALRITDNPLLARYHSHRGIIALAKKVISDTPNNQSIRYLRKELLSKNTRQKQAQQKATLNNLAEQLQKIASPKADYSVWKEPLINASLNDSCFSGVPLNIREQSQFEAAIKRSTKTLVPIATELETTLEIALEHQTRILTLANNIDATSISIDKAIEDIKAQVYHLFDPSFLSYTPLATLRQYPRYLRAIESRLEKIQFKTTPQKDIHALNDIQMAFKSKSADLTPANLPLDFVYLSYPAMAEFNLMLEEWRVSIFAQHLSTKFSVSEKRLRKYWSDNIEVL